MENLSTKEKFDKILERNANRAYFFELINKMVCNCIERDIPIIIENPYSHVGFIINAFLKSPDIIEKDRSLRGDYFVKPTAYWFFGIEPARGNTVVPYDKRKIKEIDKCKTSKQAGLCSEERSMISPLYAHNFICDFILGKETKNTQLQLF